MISSALLSTLFYDKFQKQPTVLAKSPGRINIIGEHTDYNNGFVMPAAIDKYIYVAITARKDNALHLFSQDYDEMYISDLSASAQEAPEWSKYIIGVAQIINQKTNKVKGFDLYVVGDVPLGAGLSSSAAFACATAFAINALFNCDLSRIEMAKIGQQTEHEYIGLKCGIMDQFASVLGKENNAIKLDCKDLSYEYIPVDWSEYEILLLNTNVKHSLASTAYNKRRASCEQAVAWVQEHKPEVQSLREVSLEDLNKYVKSKDKDVYIKSRFVIQENERLLKASEALKNNNIQELGALLLEAHWALSKEYEVSCPELDFLIKAAENSENVIGARMMGGGFGGCTINILPKGKADTFINEVSDRYEKQFNLQLTPIRVNLGEGSSIIK